MEERTCGSFIAGITILPGTVASAKKSVLRGRYKLKMSNLLCSIFNIQYAASNDFQDVSWMKK